MANYGDGTDNTVSVIDAATGTVTRIIWVGYGPDGVAVNPTARTISWPTVPLARCR